MISSPLLIQSAGLAVELVGEDPRALAHLSCGDAGHDGIGLHILGDHTTCAADGTLADADAGEHHHVAAQPGPVADLNRHLPVPEVARECRAAVVMLKGVDGHVAAEVHVLTDCQSLAGIEYHIVTDYCPPPTKRKCGARISVLK